MFGSLLVAVALCQDVKTLYVYTLPNCPPSVTMRAEVGNGDSELRVRWLDGQDVIGVEACPTIYDPDTGRKWTGATDLATLKRLPSTPRATARPLATAEAAHTPMAEVVRVLNLLPKPEVAFVDYGCGYDARWCIAAVEKWNCPAIGIELDHARAEAARERVRNLGLDHLILIVEGDATTVNVQADVGVAYLYPEVLEKLRTTASQLRAFASYSHQVPGLSMVKNGDTWLYTRPQQQVQYQQQTAVWGNHTYTGRVCNNPNCQMCNSIQSQLSQPAKTQQTVRRWACINGRCGWYDFPVN